MLSHIVQLFPEALIYTVLRMTWNKKEGTMKKGMNIVPDIDVRTRAHF